MRTPTLDLGCCATVLVVEEEEGGGGGGEGGGRRTIAVHLGLSTKLMLQNTCRRVNIGHKTTPTVLVNIHYNNCMIKYKFQYK